MSEEIRFNGGVVHRRSFHGAYNVIAPKITPAMRHWFDTQWRMLVRRLRYAGSRKVRGARRRILLWWGEDGLAQAMKEASS